MKPTTLYAGIGFAVGAVAGYFFAGSQSPVDLLIGALFGAFAGLLLGMSKHKIWDRR